MSSESVDPFASDPVPETAEIRVGEGLDWGRIEAFLRRELPDSLDLDGAFEVVQFPHGAANLTYLIAFGDTELVLRRPPFGTLAPGAHDMGREFKVLSRLWESFDKAPRAYVFCDDHAVAGADFFVMERCRGEVIRGVIPPSMRGHSDVARRIGFALADAMAEFHLLDPDSCGLADLGRPVGFVERQVSGWKKRWDLVADENHDSRMQALHGELERALPASQHVSFVHNDLKLDNCMIDPGDPDRVVAIFDWDMATLGDPLIDVGTLLSYWPDPSDAADDEARVTHPGMDRMGLASRAEITAHYGSVSGFDMSRVGWYEAFAQWKTVTVIQQLHYRWKVGDSTDPRMEAIADRIPSLLDTAESLVG